MNHKHIIWSNEGDHAEDADISYEAEKETLDRELDGRILVVADLGLWNGRKSGYRVVERRNLNAILDQFCGEDITLSFDGRNVVASDTHHDGTNYYTFREIREGKNVKNLLDKIFWGEAKSSDITRYTRSLAPYVKEIYGW